MVDRPLAVSVHSTSPEFTRSRSPHSPASHLVARRPSGCGRRASPRFISVRRRCEDWWRHLDARVLAPDVKNEDGRDEEKRHDEDGNWSATTGEDLMR